MATAFHERGRELVLKDDWIGISRQIGEDLTREDAPRRRAESDRQRGYFLYYTGRLDSADRQTLGVDERLAEGRRRPWGPWLRARDARGRHKEARAMTIKICSPDGGKATSQGRQIFRRFAITADPCRPAHRFHCSHRRARGGG